MALVLEPSSKPRRPATPPSRKFNPRESRLTRSVYFVGAVLIHLVVFAIVATRVIFPPPPPLPIPPVAYLLPRPVEIHVSVPTSAPKIPTAFSNASTSTPNILFSSSTPSSFVPPPIHLLGSSTGTNALPGGPSDGDSSASKAKARAEFLKGVGAFIQAGQQRPESNIQLADGEIKDYVGTFSVYLASYADGDWNCNVIIKDGAIVAGGLPDLVSKINEWSHGRIKAHMEPRPLDLGGPDLMGKKPPFIFFTGHKDFVLTDAEVANLQAYVHNGGAIWGDNALPGFGSRFDVAFRREMKRVISDRDKQFQDVPGDYPIFNHSWFNLEGLASGMNYYAEPMQHLDLGGEVAILYTPNDYSDLFFMDLLAGDKGMANTWLPPGELGLFTNGTFLYNSNLFFRNFTLSSSLAAQQLGMNIVGYLLVRYDHSLQLLP